MYFARLYIIRVDSLVRGYCPRRIQLYRFKVFTLYPVYSIDFCFYRLKNLCGFLFWLIFLKLKTLFRPHGLYSQPFQSEIPFDDIAAGLYMTCMRILSTDRMFNYTRYQEVYSVRKRCLPIKWYTRRISYGLHDKSRDNNHH